MERGARAHTTYCVASTNEPRPPGARRRAALPTTATGTLLARKGWKNFSSTLSSSIALESESTKRYWPYKPHCRALPDAVA